MAGSFQNDGFQNDAYQVDTGVPGFAFQECAFQDTGFQANVCGAIPSRLKQWTGAIWQPRTLAYFNGATFEQKPLKRWSGAAWVQ